MLIDVTIDQSGILKQEEGKHNSTLYFTGDRGTETFPGFNCVLFIVETYPALIEPIALQTESVVKKQSSICFLFRVDD